MQQRSCHHDYLYHATIDCVSVGTIDHATVTGKADVCSLITFDIHIVKYPKGSDVTFNFLMQKQAKFIFR